MTEKTSSVHEYKNVLLPSPEISTVKREAEKPALVFLTIWRHTQDTDAVRTSRSGMPSDAETLFYLWVGVLLRRASSCCTTKILHPVSVSTQDFIYDPTMASHL